MAQVLGIGGVFVKSGESGALKDWYRDVLGMELQSWGGAMLPHHPIGYHLWSVFPDSSDYFAPSTLPVMVNLIVDDLDGVLARVAAAGVDIIGREDQDENGRFGWVLDPMGVKLELWEPKPGA
jgi:predicted enzyme related to lactoylglutathione lyase